jgi:hypothetical protein
VTEEIAVRVKRVLAALRERALVPHCLEILPDGKAPLPAAINVVIRGASDEPDNIDVPEQMLCLLKLRK